MYVIQDWVKMKVDNFKEIICWYVDTGTSAPNRHQGIKTVAETLGFPESTVNKWVHTGTRPGAAESLIIDRLAQEYGQYPEYL